MSANWERREELELELPPFLELPPMASLELELPPFLCYGYVSVNWKKREIEEEGLGHSSLE